MPVNCRKCTLLNPRLQKTLTEQASKDLKKLFNKMLLFVSNIIESESVHTELNQWLSGENLRCAVASDGYYPSGAYENIDKFKNDEKEIAVAPVVDAKSDPVVDYTLFSIAGATLGGILMLIRFYNKERQWQKQLLTRKGAIKQHSGKIEIKNMQHH